MNTENLLKLCLLLPLVLLNPGCGGEDELTPAESLDLQVEESWREGRKAISAVTFFERGGVYESTDQFRDIDHDHLLPLVRRLQDECGLEMEALLDTPEIAFAIVADISAVDSQRVSIVNAIREADDMFPGVLVDSWGNRWLSLDLLDEQEAAAFEESGKLELLQNKLEANRDAQQAEGAADR